MAFKQAHLYTVALILSFTLNAIAQSKSFNGTKDLIQKMIKSIEEVQSLKYSLKITERGKKGYNFYESSVKLNRKPRKLYIYIKGIEVLWTQGVNNGKALVKPNSFPYINLNLDPMGSLMRSDQHHTIYDMGFDYFGGVVGYAVQKLGDKFESCVKYEGEERCNNRPCYKVIITNKDFTYATYTVGEKENITSIARKLFVSEYMILELNPKLNDYFDILKKGQVIKVPSWYAKTVTIYIDQLYFLPIGIKVFDDKGLFEEYNYHFLQVNPKLDDEEFTRDYREYHF
jgi:outer membrane lipoprotein-sorting protein